MDKWPLKSTGRGGDDTAISGGGGGWILCRMMGTNRLRPSIKIRNDNTLNFNLKILTYPHIRKGRHIGKSKWACAVPFLNAPLAGSLHK